MMNILWLITSIGIVAMIVLIGVLVVWKVVKEKKSGFPATDERSMKITGKAATYALYVGSYFMIAFLFTLLIGQEFLGWPEFSAMPALIVSLLVFNVTFLVVRWYLERKGESA